MSSIIGKLRLIPFREVCPHEALNFTTWFQENVEVLNDVLDLHLVDIEREQDAGTFYVDIVATDEDGNPVVIENQLEKSDHDHLGKLITYLTAMDSKTAIWIVSDPRPEHIAAVTWLNESNLASFYMIQVETVRIDNSPPAPLLTKIVGPSEEGRKIGQQKEEWAEREKLRYQFWDQLLTRAKVKTNLHSNISPSKSSSVWTSAGYTGIHLGYIIHMNEAVVKLGIDLGKESKEQNRVIFNQLRENKETIEKAFGNELIWDSEESKRACQISYIVADNGYRNPEEDWPEIQDEKINAMIRLEKAFQPFIQNLNL